MSPGTVVLADLRATEQIPEAGLRHATFVLARVVSHPAHDLVTVDAGSKALSPDVQPVGRPVGWPGLEPSIPSEEHLPLEVRSGPRPALGEALLFVPGHVCPTVNLASELWLVDEDSHERVPVTARGHD